MINPEYFNWGQRINEGIQQSQDNRRRNALTDLQVDRYKQQERQESIGRRALIRDPSIFQELGLPVDPNDPDINEIYDALAEQAGFSRGQEAQLPSSYREFELGQKNPAFAEYLKQSGSANAPATVQEWQFYSSLPQPEQQRFLEMKRAQQTFLPTVAGIPTVVRPGVAGAPTTSQPLSNLPAEAAAAGTIKGAEAAASASAQSGVERSTKGADMEATMRLYETARDGLMSGLAGTVTGPIAGRIPAVTAGQQTAEGGVAAMAPVLKQLFRVAGEGVFTDRDQALLLDMVPKRTDHPQAIANKMQNIDAIVKAKLRAPAAVSAPAQPSGNRIRYDANGKRIP